MARCCAKICAKWLSSGCRYTDEIAGNLHMSVLAVVPRITQCIKHCGMLGWETSREYHVQELGEKGITINGLTSITNLNHAAVATSQYYTNNETLFQTAY